MNDEFNNVTPRSESEVNIEKNTDPAGNSAPTAESAQPQQNPYAQQGYQQPQQNPYAQQGYQQSQQNPYAQQGYQQSQQNPYAQQGYQQSQQNPYAQQGYQQPSYTAGYYQYSPAASVQPAENDGFAIASIILGIVGIITCCTFVPSVLAVVLGIVSKVKNDGTRPTGVSTAGIVLGVIGVIFGLLWTGLMFAGIASASLS